MITRRQAIACAAAAPAPPLRAAKPRIEFVSVISQQPEFYHGWPTVAADSDGNLLVVYSGGREAHVCPFGRVEIIRSADGGRTWSWPEVILDTPIDDRAAGICSTPAGTLLLTMFTSLAYEPVLAHAKDWPPEKLERWRAVDRRTTAKEREAPLGAWMLRSTDGGMTWSSPFRVPLNSPHGPVVLSDGRLLYAGETLQCEFHDRGKSWSTPHPIDVWGLPSHLRRLRSGRLHMSYGYRRAPFGNQARLSSDHGKISYSS